MDLSLTKISTENFVKLVTDESEVKGKGSDSAYVKEAADLFKKLDKDIEYFVMYPNGDLELGLRQVFTGQYEWRPEKKRFQGMKNGSPQVRKRRKRGEAAGKGISSAA